VTQYTGDLKSSRVKRFGLAVTDLCADAYPGLAAVIAEIRRGDVAMTDLETAIRTRASGAPTREGVFLHEAGIDELRCLRTFGFDMLALANNHAGDFGRDGILATLQTTREAGFHAAGSGRNLADASRAARLATAGQPVALIAMATGKIRGRRGYRHPARHQRTATRRIWPTGKRERRAHPCSDPRCRRFGPRRRLPAQS